MHREHRVGGGDFQHAKNSRIGGDERDRPADGFSGPCSLEEHTKGGGVEKRTTRKVDDDVVGEVGTCEGLLELGAGRHVQVAFDPDDRRAVVAQRLDPHLEIACPCHERESRRRCRIQVPMNDQVSLTIPSRTSYTGVATLVLGGIGSRLDLSYERVDDLQLAVLSVLEARGAEEVTVEVEAAKERVSVSVGPLVEGSGSDQALARVLDPLVDSVEPLRRDGREWLMLQLAR